MHCMLVQFLQHVASTNENQTQASIVFGVSFSICEQVEGDCATSKLRRYFCFGCYRTQVLHSEDRVRQLAK